MAEHSVCAVIPTYNNPQTIGRVTRQVLDHVDRVIVVDDGSAEPGAHAVATLKGTPGVEVVRRDVNGGKGAAVKDGLRRARELGYSHALQIDADGQHTTADIPLLLNAAACEPKALVLGQPVFDDSVPFARRHARKLTTFWTSIEVGGRSIADPMCGLRVYPVALALSVRAQGNHMDFDPEIAVRMVWAGAPVVNVKTRVRYLAREEGGVSHFRLFRDNWLITWMHTRLVCLAILRFSLRPFGFLRPSSAPVRWDQLPETGSTLGIRILALIAEWLGRAPARLLLVFIVVGYWLSGRQARAHSREYLVRVGASHGPWQVFLHLLRFAQCSLDRFYFLADELHRFGINRHGHEHIVELAESGRGAILLGAHIGSFEALRAMARGTGMTVNVLAYFDNAEKVNQELDKRGPNRSVRVVALERRGFGHLFRIRELIEAGQCVALLGDRCFGERGAEVEFLGKKTRLPMGPYALAATLGCPILVTMAIHFAPNRYELYCEPFMDRVPKKQDDPGAFARCAQAFASRLEYYCRMAPDNWFNFYDFWNENEVN